MTSIEVVIAIINNAEGQFLVSKRPHHVPSGGYWEFPGGKIESGETQMDALVRELKEEVDVDILSARIFLQFDYKNADRLITVYAWRVEKFSGEACGLEGQPIQWLSLDDLFDLDMLPANAGVLSALKHDFTL